MVIPDKINFLGHTVKIKQVKKITDKQFCLGMYDFSKLTIELEKDLLPSRKEEVFFHEIGEMLSHYMEMEYVEITKHVGFSRYLDLFWGILKDNKLIR